MRGVHPGVDYAAVASLDDLANNDFPIDPGRYLTLANAGPALGEALRAHSVLTQRLGSLVQASRDADANLQTILGVPVDQ